MRIFSVLALTPLLGACGVLEQMQFGAPALDPNKVYLNRMDIVSVSAREAHNFACVGQPLQCTSRGVGFECYCP